MYHINVGIKGTTPLCFNRPLDELKEGLASGRGGKRETIKQAQEKANTLVHASGHGLYIPGSMIKACTLEGCGLAGLTVKRKSLFAYLRGGMVVIEKEIALGKNEPDFLYERWGRVPPGPKGTIRMIRTPAVNAGWEVKFVLLIALDTLDSDQVQQAVATGGVLVGIGNARTQGFGRFEVTQWDVLPGMPSR